MASFWIRLIICAAAFAAFGVAAVHGPFGASRIETSLAAEASERLSAAGLTWASATANGRRLALSGEAPAPDDMDLAVENAKGQALVSGVAAVDVSRLTVAPQAVPLESYDFSARLETEKLTVIGMVPDEEAFSRLTESFGARPGFVIVREFQFENVEGAESWVDAASTGMHALSLLETGELKMSMTTVELSGVANDQSSADAAESVVAGGREPFSFVLAIEGPPRDAAATEQARACQSEINKVTNGRPLTFSSGSASLSRSDRALLDRLADRLESCADVTIVIEGHTDSIGDKTTNQQLSERRAAAVQAYLGEVGAAAKFTTRGFGDTRPIAPNRSAAGQRRNRRIDFTVEEPKS